MEIGFVSRQAAGLDWVFAPKGVREDVGHFVHESFLPGKDAGRFVTGSS